MLRKSAVVVLLVAFVLAAPAASRAQGPASCSTSGQNLYVRDVMTDIYYWYEHLPFVNPTDYGSPEEYLEAIRYRPLDSSFSYITSRAANDAFFSESQYIGLGFSSWIIGQQMRVREVFPASPAADAGLARGDRITAINGREIGDLLASGDIDGVFGPGEIGVETTLRFRKPNGDSREVRMAKRLVTIPTVSLTRVYDAGGVKVGYIIFENFVQPSTAALDAAFDELRAADVRELVLDVRYNGGGLVSVAQHLASLIGGTKAEGQTFAEYFHNDKNRFRNRILRFEPKPNALRLDRVVVITTQLSASASELVINSLKPFMPVLLVGDTTYGKPVGQYQINFCDKVLAPVSFTLRNANGDGNFFDGFAPLCPAPDDLDRELGDSQEASLREALTVAVTGACSGRASAALRARGERPRRAVGWQAVVNAY
jgi:carboxyl-terminal processing protease